MVTLKEQDAEFPEASEKVYTTVVTPIGKTSPGACDAVRATDPESSVAVGSGQVTLTSVIPLGVVKITSLGQLVMTGS